MSERDRTIASLHDELTVANESLQKVRAAAPLITESAQVWRRPEQPTVVDLCESQDCELGEREAQIRWFTGGGTGKRRVGS